MIRRNLIFIIAFASSCATNSNHKVNSDIEPNHDEFVEPKTPDNISNPESQTFFGKSVIFHRLDESIEPDERTSKLLRGHGKGMVLRVQVIQSDRDLNVRLAELGQKTFFRGFGGPWATEPLHMFECDWSNILRAYKFDDHLIGCRGKYFFAVFEGDTDSENLTVDEPYQSWWVETIQKRGKGYGIRRSLKLYTYYPDYAFQRESQHQVRWLPYRREVSE